MIDSTVLGASAVVCLVVVVLFTITRCVRYVGNNRVAIVEKIWSRKGSISAGLIAMGGEAGYQPVVLRGGAPLEPTQTLASNAATADFLDVAAFLANGGQKGPQRTILREGTYAINL